jgi:hypothetical protein
MQPAENCTADCSCTSYATVLAVDTSHLCCLGRLASQQPDEAASFVGLVSVHLCGGARELVTSSELLIEELDLAKADCPVRTYAPSAPIDSLDCIKSVAAPAAEVLRLSALTCESPDGGTISVGSRDVTLVVAAEQAGQDSDVVLVSDDEDLLLWQAEMLFEGEVAAMPLHVLQLISQMVSCGALPVTAFLDAAEAESQHYEELTAPAAWKIARKRGRLERLTNAVAAALSEEDQ